MSTPAPQDILVLRNDAQSLVNPDFTPSFTDPREAARFLLEVIRYAVRHEIRISCDDDGAHVVVRGTWDTDPATGEKEFTHGASYCSLDEREWQFSSCCSDYPSNRALSELVRKLFPPNKWVEDPPFVRRRDRVPRGEVYSLSVADLIDFAEHGYLDSVSEAKAKFGERWQKWLDPQL